MDFKPGDVVKLKSGSPPMTISSVGSSQMSSRVQAGCIWFDGTAEKRASFPLETLELVTDQGRLTPGPSGAV